MAALHSGYGALLTSEAPCLNTSTIQQPRAALSRLHMLFHMALISALLYYRLSNLIHGTVPILSWGLMTFAEIIFAFIWTLNQGLRWCPIVRTVAPDNLPGDEELPGVDVFICTAEPGKEHVVEMMNTVLSAMSLDYPVEKLAVYLSDDGGSSVTLGAMKEVCVFATCWIPFCRKFGVQSRCPEAFFSSFGDCERENLERHSQFKEEEQILQSKYEAFKRNVEKVAEVDDSVKHDRHPYVEVICDTTTNSEEATIDQYNKLPLLVYVSRERRSSYPQRLKAGALNVLLRVSGVMTNAPYALVLDYDMYCNDPTSTKQAMCFYLDPKLSGSLSFVQFPQIFYNASKNNIYDAQARSTYKTKYQGMDGISGPVCAGTGYYLNKKSLYCRPNCEDEYLVEPEKSFGLSSKLINSIMQLNGEPMNNYEKGSPSCAATIAEAEKLATCTFEYNTIWGKQIGYSYDCLLESTFTGYMLHCKGWKSVYLYPNRPCFLGCTTIDMKDALVQLMKWASGLVQLGLSNFSPLTYGMSSRMPFMQSMCYGYFTFTHLFSLPCLLYGVIPQFCFLYAIPVYPKVSSPWFLPFATLFLSSSSQHLYEVVTCGGSIKTMWNEQRIWIIKSVTSCLFGCLDVMIKYVKANFRQSNKAAIDRVMFEEHEKENFNLQRSAKMFMIPLTTLVILNLGCFIGGLKQIIVGGIFQEMFGQGLLSFYILVLSYPILGGLIPKIGKY